MKLLLIVTLVFSAANAAVRVGNVLADSVEGSWSEQVLHLRVPSTQEMSEADQRLATSLSQAEATGRNTVANGIKEALEGLREVVINGNENLPPLDPFRVESVGPIDFSTTGVRAAVNVNNFNMEGLRWYVVDRVDFNALRLNMGAQLTVPWITCTGSYDVNARIALLSHQAGGNFRFFINRLELSMDTRLGTSLLSGSLFLRELDINIKIFDVQVTIEGMVGSNVLNGIINSFVQNAAKNLLVDQMEDLSRQLSDSLFDTINDILKDFSINDLL